MAAATTDVIKYLDEDGLKLLYSRLNDRYRIVDALPDISMMSSSARKVIYVLRANVEGVTTYAPYVVDGVSWHNIASDEAAVALKADKVTNATEGNVATLDAEGNLADGGIPPGTFVALTYDRVEYGRATDLRDTWGAFMSGMPVVLLDNRGSGVIAQMTEIGYLWVEGNNYVTRCVDGEDDSIVDGTVHGYYSYGTGKFYEDAACTKVIQGVANSLYLNLAPGRGSGKVYRFDGAAYSMVQRYVQFQSARPTQEPGVPWEQSSGVKSLFFRMVEPLEGFSPDTFQVVEINNGGSQEGGNANVKYVAETMMELYRLMSNGDLGWCTGNETLYIMVGSALKPVSPGGGSGGTTVIRGTAGQIDAITETVGGVEVVTLSLAPEAVEAQVPKATVGDKGKVLTVNEDGQYVWEDPIVQSIDTTEL